MQNLQKGAILQNGRYKIIETLGQGGFGITYLAMQSGLERKVAIKEFFMKEICGRDGNTSHVTLGTEGGRETATRYREKFMKEARNIAKLSHKNIVHIIDVFEENNTSYYVMEYVENGSLADKVKRKGCLSEPVATRYILQVADALHYIHQQKMSHLDVKPANVMLNAKDEAVLIDFGLSKQYDTATGSQTSTTPVGISEGYAPMEQYKQGGVGEFSPKTDIYSLGATFFYLLTGTRPPSASDVLENGLPIAPLRAHGVSQKAIDIICKAMEGRRKDRMDDIVSFINGLTQETADGSSAGRNFPKGDSSDAEKNNRQMSGDNGDTVIKSANGNNGKEKEKAKSNKKKNGVKKIGITVSVVAIISIVSAVIYNNVSFAGDNPNPEDDSTGSTEVSLTEQTFTVGGVSFTMMPVEGGTFTMGATSEQQEPYDDEKPIHRVTLSGYYIGKYEVTQALWKAVMGSNPSYWKGDNLPVEEVFWDDCQTFIRKLNSMTGKTFRLPTEAEWEYAARGGNRSRGYQYSGSNNIDDVAWYDGNSGGNTHKVGTKSPNELGIYDMNGNVLEWCQDWYGSYSSSAQTNPKGPSSGSYRVSRGGSCGFINARDCRSSNRLSFSSGSGNNFLGFRLALSPVATGRNIEEKVIPVKSVPQIRP